MNLHAVASAVVGAVNPNLPVTVQFSTGNSEHADGSQTPTYSAPVEMTGQKQPMTYRELQQLDGMNLQGLRDAVYLSGNIQGVQRLTQKGGDLITFPDGTVWLTVQVIENWPEWCKVAVQQQLDSA